MLSQELRQCLLGLARASIEHGLQHQRACPIQLTDFAVELREPGASFVTLHRMGALRGCIGTLEAYRPLAEDVAHNAFSAAFRDPRFPPVQHQELTDLDIHISVLGAAEAMEFSSQTDLERQLRPGVDGLILEANGHRGTFLPSVWEQVPDPHTFLQHLKQKAGLPPDFWSGAVSISRYQTESFPD